MKADGPGGAPGTVLASKQVNISAFDTTFGAFNEVFWTAPVTQSGQLLHGNYIACFLHRRSFNLKPSLRYSRALLELVEIRVALHDSAQGTGWGKYGGTWYNYGTFWAGVGSGYASLSLYSLFIQAQACGPITVTPTAAFNLQKEERYFDRFWS